MIGVKVNIHDNATPAIRRVTGFLSSPAARQIAGFEGQRVVREHLQTLDETRANRLGGRRSHYYGSARRSTTYYAEGDSVIVSIAQIGIRLHYYGGTVLPGVGTSSATGGATKYLAIPVDAEAYGRRPAEFDLVVLWGARGPYGLAMAERTESLHPHHGLTVTTKPGKMMFALRDSVTLQPDPTILPNMEKLGYAIGDRLATVIARRWNVGSEVETEAQP